VTARCRITASPASRSSQGAIAGSRQATTGTALDSEKRVSVVCDGGPQRTNCPLDTARRGRIVAAVSSSRAVDVFEMPWLTASFGAISLPGA
jgi:hypothetical protein